eukprot:5414097-Heterocapsa_arctica.AAC.1
MGTCKEIQHSQSWCPAWRGRRPGRHWCRPRRHWCRPRRHRCRPRSTAWQAPARAGPDRARRAVAF